MTVLPTDTTSVESIIDPSGQFANEVKDIVLAVGAFIRHEHKSFTREQAEIKGRNDLVTFVDRESERRLQVAFRSLLPESGFIMEETGEVDRDADFIWIMDPLDGTTNFVYGIPAFCVSVGLQHKGKTILGVVYEINRDELFFATLGRGATLNGEPIRVSQSTTLAQCLIATGFPFRRFQHIDQYMAMLVSFMKQSKGLRRIGSAALDLAYVAAGRFDAFFEANLHPWDVTAGALLVQEAGGMVTDYFGKGDFLFGGMIIAAAPGVHPKMIETVQEHLNLPKA